MQTYNFSFSSYDVPVSIDSNSREILEKASSVARSALLDRVTEIDPSSAKQHFQLFVEGDGTCAMIQNGEEMVSAEPEDRFWKFFDSLIRIAVAEYSMPLIFVHAGVVSWKQKAIVLPGTSFCGKTTLVAELVRRGAEYYSDEYALFDEAGLVHPFARPLSLRTNGENIREISTNVSQLGGRAASNPARVGCVLFTKYEPESDIGSWKPEFLTAGQGVMEIIPQTIGIRRNSELAIKVLKNAITSAIIVKSARPDSVKFAEVLLEFVDNKAF